MAGNTMKKIKILLAAVACLALVACKSTLAPGGAYNQTNSVGAAVTGSQMDLYIADGAFELAYQALDTAFTTEMNNRALFWSISPNIKHGLDAIRPQAVTVRNTYIAARASYLANPTPAGLTGVQSVLAQLQQLTSSAQAALAVPGVSLTATTNSATAK